MTVLRGQSRPAVLIEGGYLSNPREARLIARPEFRQKLAEAVASALNILLQRNPLYSALSLIGTLLALSALYLTVRAQFIAAVQIVVYAGAIMVLFIFAILSSGLIPVVIQQDKAQYFFAALSFVAGFSERFAQDVVARTESALSQPQSADA